MSDPSIAVPDFYGRLGLEPGRELHMFPARLREVVELHDELPAPDWEQRRAALEELYQRHGGPPQPEHFAEAIVAEEAATEPADEQGLEIRLPAAGGFSFGFASRNDSESAPPVVHTFSRCYGYCSHIDNINWFQWSSRGHIDGLYELTLDECRRSGGMGIPEHWTPSTLLVSAANQFWTCEMRDGLAFYTGINTQRFRDLMDFAGTLLVAEAAPWLVQGHGQAWDQHEAFEQGVFDAWDAAMSYHAGRRYAETIDTLRILQLAGCSHPRAERAVRDLLGSESMSVRNAVAVMVLDDALAAYNPAVSPELLVALVERACAEQVRAVAEKLVHTLRLQGGEESFEALMQVAKNASTLYARDAASRALAWVPRYSERLQRLSEFARSRDKRSSRVAMKAMNEAKVHGLFSRGGEFASNIERELHNATMKFLGSGSSDEDAAGQMEFAFAQGFLRLEIEGDPGSPDCTAAIMTCDEVPLLTEQAHTLEFCGLLNRLPSVNVPAANLSDEELQWERALRLAFDGSAVRFQGTQRQKIAQAVLAVENAHRKTVANSVNEFWTRQEQGSAVPNLILSLDKAPTQFLQAYLLLLEALPTIAHSVQNLFIKGSGTGAKQWINAFRDRCPNLKTYWGYLAEFPEDGAEHMKRFVEGKDDPDQFNRQQLRGLDGVDHIALWSKRDGYQPPG